MRVPGGMELFFIFLIILVLFGSKKIPEIGRGLGKGIQNFRKSLKGEDEVDVTPSPDQNDQIHDPKSTSTQREESKEKTKV